MDENGRRGVRTGMTGFDCHLEGPASDATSEGLLEKI